jgi:hypothetical protein
MAHEHRTFQDGGSSYVLVYNLPTRSQTEACLNPKIALTVQAVKGRRFN